MRPAQSELLTGVLKSVSRSFYLTLRVLPRAIRPQIGVAYLLARATDTIADTDAVPASERIGVLHAVRKRIVRESGQPLVLERFLSDPTAASQAERNALARLEEIIAVLRGFSADDQAAIAKVLETITSGQELDLQRFSKASPERIVALKTNEELDDYTWRVAGCVGEFWTTLCRTHLFPRARLEEKKFNEDGIRFGKGLQLVNILRDVPRDLAAGRCYLPAEELHAIGLSPNDLLSHHNETRLRPLYNRYLETARQHLVCGWQYVNTIPGNQFRLRLACAWPILIGAKTLQELERRNPLDPAQRIKVSRAEVRSIVLRSSVALLRPKAWRKLFEPVVYR